MYGDIAIHSVTAYGLMEYLRRTYLYTYISNIILPKIIIQNSHSQGSSLNNINLLMETSVGTVPISSLSKETRHSRRTVPFPAHQAQGICISVLSLG